MVQFFRHIEEIEWAIELAKTYGKPIAATMCIGPKGDETGVSVQECGVRLARAGADIVGINCLFDPFIALDTMAMMKEGLELAGLKKHLMLQPLGFRTPDGGHHGWSNLWEFPLGEQKYNFKELAEILCNWIIFLALEPRKITRFEAAKYARKAYDLGISYIGGCCGFEAYHIRAMAEELQNERGKLPEASQKSDHDMSIMKMKLKTDSNNYKNPEKATKEYWMTMRPTTGRPMSAPFCCQPDPEVTLSSVFQ